MKKAIFLFVLFSLFFTPLFKAAAQTGNTQGPVIFDMTGFPQWAKDLRRWEIVAFGAFPISMFLATFSYDMYRWNNANGMEFSAEGRRYAPWPLKSAGAVELTNEEFKTTILLAIGISAVIAFADLIIVKVKQYRERRRMESMPAGSVTIDRRQQGDGEPALESEDETGAGEPVPE